MTTEHYDGFGLQVVSNDTRPTYDIDAILAAGQERGKMIPHGIHTLQMQLAELATVLDPRDEIRPMNQAALRYVDGKACFSFMGQDGVWSDPMGLTSHAYRQLGEKVLGPGGLKFIESQRTTNEQGEKLATINWMERLGNAGSRGLFRSMKFPGVESRVIRACLSGSDRGFTTNLDNIDVVRLLAETEDFARLPLLSYRVTPDAMRIRVLLDPNMAHMFDATGKPIDPDLVKSKIPVPMFEIGNGETGNSSIFWESKMWTFSCLNGQGSWGPDRFIQRFAHTGGTDRGEKIKSALGDALVSARVAASGQVESFKAATALAIDDVFKLLDTYGRKEGLLSGEQVRRATECARDETSYPGMNVANALSGVTLAAQAESSMLGQRKMETAAGRIMMRALSRGSLGVRNDLQGEA